MTERDASIKGSYLLAGSVALYPIVCHFALSSIRSLHTSMQTGFVVDRVKHRGFVMQLFTASAVLTLLCYSWLALSPDITTTPMPAIAAFATGHGFAPCE